MRNPLFLALACVVATAPSAVAQVTGTPSPEERARIYELAEDFGQWRHSTGWMGVRWLSSYSDRAGSLSIFPAPTTVGAPSGQPTRARFVAKQIDRLANQPDVVGWTDSDRCPALMDLVRSYETLEAPRTVVPGLRWPLEWPKMILHGWHWTIWSNQGVQDGRYPATITLAASAGPIAEWAQEARESLKECWSPDEPSEIF